MFCVFNFLQHDNTKTKHGNKLTILVKYYIFCNCSLDMKTKKNNFFDELLKLQKEDTYRYSFNIYQIKHKPS